jgi:hypothetical protein
MLAHFMPGGNSQGFFSWITPGFLARMSTPQNESVITTLRQMDISLVVTLTAEQPLKQEWFRNVPGGGIENMFFFY